MRAFLKHPGCRYRRVIAGRGSPVAGERAELGLTLVELLIVIVIIGILTAIALIVTDPRPAAYLAVMESDLRNVAPAQEAYQAEHGRYANSADELAIRTSPNVELVVLGDESGWTARVQHEIRTDFRCAMYHGPFWPVFAPAEQEGLVECEPKKATGKNKLKKK